MADVDVPASSEDLFDAYLRDERLQFADPTHRPGASPSSAVLVASGL
jgi:hypothetical protein